MTKRTKASMMRTAQEITEALRDLEHALVNSSEAKSNWRDIFRNGIQVGFQDGNAELLHVNTNVNTLSGHDRVKLLIWKTDMEAQALKVGALFATLLPGLALTWVLDPGNHDIGSYHTLKMGIRRETGVTIGSGHHYVIHTVLARWKAPLVRLAQYLDLYKNEKPENRWVFGISDSLTKHKGVCGRVNVAEVPAHTLQDAYKQFTFHRPEHVATPKPKEISTKLCAKLVDIEKGHALSTLDKKLQNAEKTLEDMPLSITNAALNLQKTLDMLATELRGKITINLKTGKTKADFEKHPFAASSDIETQNPIRKDALKKAQDMGDLLKTYFDTHHPKMLKGKIDITCGKTLTTSNKLWGWKLTADGYVCNVKYNTLKAISLAAHILNVCDVNDSLTTYIVSKESPNWQEDVNQLKDCALIRASTPAHAWAIYNASGCTIKANYTHEMKILKPVDAKDRDAAMEKSFKDILSLY